MAGSVSLVTVSVALHICAVLAGGVPQDCGRHGAEFAVQARHNDGIPAACPQRRDRAQMVIETAIEPVSVGSPERSCGAQFHPGRCSGRSKSDSRRQSDVSYLLWLDGDGATCAPGVSERCDEGVAPGSLRAEVLTLMTQRSHCFQSASSHPSPRSPLSAQGHAGKHGAGQVCGTSSGTVGHPEPDVRAAVARRMEQLRLTRFGLHWKNNWRTKALLWCAHRSCVLWARRATPL